MRHGAGTVNMLLTSCNKASVSKGKRGIEKGPDINGSQV